MKKTSSKSNRYGLLRHSEPVEVAMIVSSFVHLGISMSERRVDLCTQLGRSGK
ncbi:hypothetical protein [Brevibacillus choshinensis]|uniref:hypothetical protein n=1 Tax=Brevibacillus choshinensis TaxID=54911 RepID=UPI002E1E2E53|nr:hypothetical protein [Brevibacillus choshinensis]